MDRGAFLRALPFLTQFDNSTNNNTWPPKQTSSILETDLILKNHLISVEPNESGPARFASNDEQEKMDDDSLWTCDACIVTMTERKSNQGSKPSPSASSASTSLSLSQSPKVPSQQQQAMEKVERMHLVLFLDGQHVVEVDLNLLLGMDLHENAADAIPNLVLQFESCRFRIFSQESLTTDKGSNDDYAVLQSAASKLKMVLSDIEKQSPTQTQNNDEYSTPLHQNMSVTTSSTTGGVVVQGGGDSQTASGSQNQGVNNTSSPLVGIKRKRAALNRSWNSLQSLDRILKLPRQVFSKEENASETLEPVLTSAAEELASSYCRKRDVQAAMETCHQTVQSYDTQLHQVLAAAFPPPTRNRRHATTTTTTTSPPATTTTTLPMAEATNTQALLESTQELLQKQKAAFQERLELALLPIRE